MCVCVCVCVITKTLRKLKKSFFNFKDTMVLLSMYTDIMQMTLLRRVLIV